MAGVFKVTGARQARAALRRVTGLAAVCLGLAGCPQDGGAAEAKPEAAVAPAKFKISGYGLFGNRELRRLINSLDLGGKTTEFFTPAFVEDASMILAAKLRSDGYLRPV